MPWFVDKVQEYVMINGVNFDCKRFSFLTLLLLIILRNRMLITWGAEKTARCHANAKNQHLKWLKQCKNVSCVNNPVHFYYGESKDSMWAWHPDPAFKFRWIKHYQSSNMFLSHFKGICWVYVALDLVQVSFLCFASLISGFQETGSP